jgi:hypothetical protein
MTTHSRLDAAALVNSQIDVNRAVFLMNARNNRNHHPYSLLDDEALSDAAISEHIASAIEHLKKAQASLTVQEDLFK